MARVSNISALKRKRATVKASCTRIRTYVDPITDVTPEIISNLEERKEKLSLQWTDYNKIQFELDSLCEEESDDREAFETMFFELTATLRRMINSTSSTHTATPERYSVTTANHNSSNQIRLPKLNLPKFSRKYEDWFPFDDTFNVVINSNETLSDIQKFQYLKSLVVYK